MPDDVDPASRPPHRRASDRGLTLVALSAAYGAGGSLIGPDLARRLHVPFVDRGIQMAVAHQLDIPLDDAIAHEQPSGSGLLHRLLAGFLGADVGSPTPLPAEAFTPEDFHQASRDALLSQASTGAGVILGRGAVPALRRDPRALRVRITGPEQRRLEQAMQMGKLDRDAAGRALRNMDRTHAEYVRQFYEVDIDDPALYHLVIDATALPATACVAMIEMAARSISGPTEPTVHN